MKPIYLHGIGNAVPDNYLTNEDLVTKLDFKPVNIGNITSKSRATCLESDYLFNSKNLTPSDNLQSLIATPTDLCEIAVNKSVNDYQFNLADLGLIMGDTSSQLELIPGEAQRVGERLNLRVPAFDHGGASAGMVLGMEAVANWKLAMCPEFIMLVSVHTPTRFIAYNGNTEGVVFGDGAVATIISQHHISDIVISEIYTESPAQSRYSSMLDLYGCLVWDQVAFEKELFIILEKSLLAIGERLKTGKYGLIIPEINIGTIETILKKWGISKECLTISNLNRGFAMGACSFITLAEQLICRNSLIYSNSYKKSFVLSLDPSLSWGRCLITDNRS
jgi:hypothetical protein